MSTTKPVAFEVAPHSLGFPVSVVLRNVSERWLAIAQCADSRHVGLGATARDALASAFRPLGPRTAAILMADPALFGASLRLLAA
jgi:hypothetical protein